MRDVSILLAVVLALATFGCGKNQSTVTPDGSVSPPQNLKALSLNRQAVRLEWTAPPEVSDSAFGGYILEWGAVRDTLAKALLTFTADSMAPGAVTFTMYSYSRSGSISAAAAIRWAPAERFPNAYTLFENRGVSSAGNSAIDVGTGGGSPVTMPLDNNALGKADLFVYGGSGQVQGTLLLESTSLYQANYKQTLFSTVTHSSATLDYALPAFPSTSTFTESAIAVNAGTIYYAQLSGAGSDLYYARILVSAVGGSFPARSVTLRISLQRLVNTPYAEAVPGEVCRPLTAVVLPFAH